MGVGTAQNNCRFLHTEDRRRFCAQTFAVELIYTQQIVTENGDFLRSVVETYRGEIEIIIFRICDIFLAVTGDFCADFRRDYFFTECDLHKFCQYPKFCKKLVVDFVNTFTCNVQNIS